MSTSESQNPTPSDKKVRQEGVDLTITDAIPIPISVLAPDGTALYVNPMGLESVGVTLEEVKRKGHLGLTCHLDDLDRVLDNRRMGLSKGVAFDLEMRLLKRGEYRWNLVQYSPLKDESGSTIRWYVTAIDIEDRKRAEEKLRQSEQDLRTMTDAIRHSVVVLAPDGKVLHANRVALDLTGLTLSEVKDQDFSRVYHPDETDHLREERKRRLSDGDPFDLEMRLRFKSGQYRWQLVKYTPLKDDSGKILRWYATATDIDDRKRAEDTLRAAEFSLRQTVDSIPGLVARMSPAGEVEAANRQLLLFYGKTLEEMKNWKTSDIVHPEDLPRAIEIASNSFSTGEPFDLEIRVRRFDGVYRWFQARTRPLRDAEGRILHWYALHTDIDDQKRTEEKLRRSEDELRTITDTIRQHIVVLAPDGTTLYANRVALDQTGLTIDEVKQRDFFAQVFHPDDVDRLAAERQQGLSDGKPFELEMRSPQKNGEYRWQFVQYNPLRGESGEIIRWYVTTTDIDDRKRAEEKLQQSEADLRTMIDTIRQPVVVLTPDGTTLHANQVFLDLTGFSRDMLDEQGFWDRVVHPDDASRLRAEHRERLLRGDPFDLESRVWSKNGQYRWHLSQYNPLKDESGKVIRWYITATDIDDRKRAEEKVRQSEQDLRTMIDAIRQYAVVLAPDGKVLYANRVALDLTGITPEEASDGGYFPRAFHPDDVEHVRVDRQGKLLRGTPFDLQMRLLCKNGQYRWQLFQYNPLIDESGEIIRWYCTATDIDDQKKTEERLRNENLVLREEIDRSSMFEEIVGSSKPIRQLLKQVEKVAPSDSTVLILGETGTGKELIAHALHRRSKRTNRAFIRVNCAAIPQSLIASELFGHEKGAFTGALQRRVGRFEAANGGTLFLDEIGELPMETQIALLRVLQEKEFERVGSNHPISVDVRLIAATNRDLPAAVADGAFRQDLFFRLNVFPIPVPSLRERVDDIPLLVEYFVSRFAKEAGKTIRHIGKDTLEQLQGYDWPGNIRELQNVVERAVILSETDTFVVDDSWLKGQSEESPPKRGLSTLEDREVEMIKAALAETHGRISGPSGAAAKLGIPRQTLESKIRRLGLDKYGQRRPTA
jgi:PAS domain S-box-containing protein